VPPLDAAAAVPPPEPIPDGAPPIAEAPQGGLRKRVMSGAFWLMLSYVFGQLLSLASSVVLTRLLFPEDYGLLMLVNAVITALHLFSDIGINQSLIHSKRGEEPDFINTAWTLQILRGLALGLASFVVAWPAAWYYADQDPTQELRWLIPAMGFTEILNGFASTSLITLNRRLVLGKVVLLDIIINVVQFAVQVAWALAWRNVWALIAGPVVGSLLRTVASHWVLANYRNRLRWERTAVRELVHFGKWIYVGTALAFVANQIDTFTLGKVALGGFAVLGVYSIAKRLANIPGAIMAPFSTQLIFPMYTRLLEQGRPLGVIFHRVHLVGGGVAALLMAGLLATGHPLVECLYPANFQDAGWMLWIIAFSCWFSILDHLEASALLAMGKSTFSTISNGADVLMMAVAMPLGYRWFGVPGLIGGFVLGDFMRYVATVWQLAREKLPVLQYDLILSLFVVLTGVAAVWLGPRIWPENEYLAFLEWFGIKPREVPLVRMLVQGTFVVLVWGAVAGLCWRAGMLKMPPREQQV
jgi:O-antigen/teichoic acid export membrane protein